MLASCSATSTRSTGARWLSAGADGDERDVWSLGPTCTMPPPRSCRWRGADGTAIEGITLQQGTTRPDRMIGGAAAPLYSAIARRLGIPACGIPHVATAASAAGATLSDLQATAAHGGRPDHGARRPAGRLDPGEPASSATPSARARAPGLRGGRPVLGRARHPPRCGDRGAARGESPGTRTRLEQLRGTSTPSTTGLRCARRRLSRRDRHPRRTSVAPREMSRRGAPSGCVRAPERRTAPCLLPGLGLSTS
jgi:hypothetical protein